MIKPLLTITFFFLLTVIFGQDDKKKYEYEMCVYHKSKDKPALLKNQVIGISDTTLSIVKGHVYDYKNKPLAFSPIKFDKKTSGKKAGCVADSSGSFLIFLSPGEYDMTVMYVGYQEFKLNNIKIATGQIREIEVKLGNSNGYTMYTIASDKPLTKIKLKRTERQLRRKR